MYGVIRSYALQPGTRDEVVRLVREEFAPEISGTPGLIGYFVLESEGDELTTVSVFEDEAGARASTQRAAAFTGRHSDLLPAATRIVHGSIPIQVGLSAG